MITDCKAHKVIVKGKTADPLKVQERIERKSHRKVELLTELPKPPPEDPKKAEEEKEKPKPEEKKEEVFFFFFPCFLFSYMDFTIFLFQISISRFYDFIFCCLFLIYSLR